MDLTTTMKIKRRIVNIIPDETADTTDASIKLSNWLESTDTSDKKIRVSSFYMNNSAIPCFVPKWTNSLPPSGFQGTPSTSILNNTLNSDTLDYFWNLNNGVTANRGGVLNMEQGESRYPALRPSIRPPNEFSQLSNKYFWFFNTSDFLDIIVRQINSEIAAHTLDQYGIAMVRTADGYGLYVPVSLTATWSLQFSQTLIDLFQFKNTKSANSSLLFDINFNDAPRSYYVPDVTSPGTYSNQSCLFVFSNYVPDTWFPFDQILLRTDMPIEAETFFNNSNYVSQNYQNILFAYKVSNNNPDGIYNFYTYDPDPAAGWVSFVGTNTRDSINFEFLLRFKDTKDVIPYLIKPRENFYFVIEEIHTD
jgi:hypothetical protein